MLRGRTLYRSLIGEFIDRRVIAKKCLHPMPQLAPKPVSKRYSEALFRPLENGLRNDSADGATEKPFRLAVASR